MISKITDRLSISAIAVSLILTLLLSGHALADIVLPTSFYGTIKTNGTDAPAGTIITAKIDGIEKGSYTTRELGKYGSSDPNQGDVLVVKTDKTSDIGKTIEFWINGIKIDKTAIFNSKNQQLNLVLDMTQKNPTDASESIAEQLTVTVTPKQTIKANTALSDDIVKQELAIATTPTGQKDGNETSPSSWFAPMVGILGVLAVIITIIVLYISKRKYL